MITSRTAAAIDLIEEILAREFGMRSQRIVKRHAAAVVSRSDDQQRQNHSRHAHAGSQHRDNFVRPRHPPKSEKEREQKRNRQQMTRTCGI